MFANLLASARELRFPLTIGYSALFAAWILFGVPVSAAARSDPLGSRMLLALDSLGSAAELGIITFVAAMVGSVLWHAGVARLVRFIAAKGGHPDWRALIDEASEVARRYGEYRVVTVKGGTATFDQTHTVPSAAWGAHLAERVQERERKAAEMSFRITLAIALIPIAVALGIEGGGFWWLSFVALPLVWLDVALLKHSTLRVVNQFKLEDLQEQLKSREKQLKDAETRATPAGVGADAARDARLQKVRDEVNELRAKIQRIKAQTERRASKFFALLEGEPER